MDRVRMDLKYTRTAAYQARARLMDSWCEFGIAKSPFSGNGSQVSGVKLAHYQDTLDSLNMFSQSDETFVIISGISGVGKTSIIESFIAETDAITCVVNCNSAMPGESLFEQLLFDSGLNIPLMSMSDSAKVSLFLDEIENRAENTILVLEDAHLMNAGSLKLVLEILSKQQRTNYFKVIMSGRETLYERVIKQYTHDIAVRPLHFLVAPLPEHQLKAYLHSCLVKANWPGVLPEIPAPVLKQIYDLSDGVPYRINLAADKILCNHLLGQDNHIPAHLQQDSEFLSYNFFVNCFMSVCYLVLLCGCYGWYSSVLSPTKYAEKEPTVAPISTPAPTPKVQVASLAPVTKVSLPKVDSQPMNNTEFLKYIGTKIDVSETKESLKTHVEKNSAIKPIKIAKTIPTSEPKINLFRDKSILASQTGYTLQVMASYNLDTIVKFKQNSTLGENMHIHETVKDHQHWYVLTYSNFANYNAAKHAQKILQVKHNIRGAWVKSLSQVHTEINKNLI
jgi:type II secretory pathway predicted ATPase ExeA